MAEDIYGPSAPHLQGKTFRHKFQYLEHIMVPNFSKVILDMCNNVTLLCDLIRINIIVVMNTIIQPILFDAVSMIKNQKLKNIEDGIKKVNKLYLQKCFDITHIHVYNSFETLQA